ncbi:MAG: hypothetical protein ABSB76_35585 [Streptosporangiaceae bacterium]
MRATDGSGSVANGPPNIEGSGSAVRAAEVGQVRWLDLVVRVRANLYQMDALGTGEYAMSIRQSKPVRLRKSWRTKDGATIPAGTEIWVHEEQEQELREGGFLEDSNAQDYSDPIPGGAVEDDDMPLTYGPGEPDVEFLDVHDDTPGS